MKRSEHTGRCLDQGEGKSLKTSNMDIPKLNISEAYTTSLFAVNISGATYAKVVPAVKSNGVIFTQKVNILLRNIRYSKQSP